MLDEAHGLKNSRSHKHQVISAVRTKRRVALTGTPLQNNLMEYHVMVSLVRGPVLGSSAEFKKRFQDPIDNGLMVDSCVEINLCVGGTSLSHFAAMTRPCWLCRAVRNRHRHAIEQASRRCVEVDATIQDERAVKF